MELQIVSAGRILGMVFSLVISVGVPIALLLYLHKKKGAKIASFFIGGGVFFVMAMVLEQILHVAVLTATGDVLRENIWALAVYGGLAAALFEETGRYIAMRYFLKKNLDTENALMYGAGHGGFEAILIVGLVYVNNLVTSIMINTGNMEASLMVLDESVRTTTLEQISALWTLPAYTFYMAGVERLCAIIMQITFSVLMYCSVRYGKKLCIALAFGMHFLVDFITVVCANYVNIVVVEVIVIVMSAAMVVVSYRIWKREALK